MHNIMRYIRQNRKKIIRYAIIVAFLFIILQILNNLSKNKNQEGFLNISGQNIYDITNGTVKADQSMVSGGKISRESINKVNQTISEFVECCNSGKKEEAYNLLSNDCKEEVYPSIDSFITNYYDPLFNGNSRNYSIQNWTGDTYMVKLTQDILATGKPVSEGSYTDYITIVTEENRAKLNISSFIGKDKINKENESDNIKIKVLNRAKYMEYEIYEIEATNNNDETFMLDQPIPEKKGIYLKDNKDVKHYAFSNEIIDEDIKIQPKFTKKIKIKYDSPYVSSRKIKNVCFSRIVLLNQSEKERAVFVNISVNL